MAMRSSLARSSSSPFMEASRRTVRYFSDGKGRVLGEEERAAENVYIQKKERERMEKLKAKLEKEKAAKEKSDKVVEFAVKFLKNPFFGPVNHCKPLMIKVKDDADSTGKA